MAFPSSRSRFLYRAKSSNYQVHKGGTAPMAFASFVKAYFVAFCCFITERTWRDWSVHINCPWPWMTYAPTLPTNCELHSPGQLLRMSTGTLLSQLRMRLPCHGCKPLSFSHVPSICSMPISSPSRMQTRSRSDMPPIKSTQATCRRPSRLSNGGGHYSGQKCVISALQSTGVLAPTPS